MIGKAKILLLAVFVAGSLFAGDEENDRLVTNTVFVAFDMETTGFNSENDRLVEIGAVKFRGDGSVLSSASWLVNPQRDIPFYATEVHGILTEMVTTAPVFSEVWPQFEAFCGDAVLLAHNAAFDVGFLLAELERAGMNAPSMPIADTLALFRKWFPHEKSCSLGKLTTSLGVPGETYHRAEADSFHIVNVFRIGIQKRDELTMLRFEQDAGGYQWLDGRALP
ncbi:3'-5' exonuclease [Tichowtungia aerotolerans]|uniref:3'-5' exonuclease n=1 Tax=Tichowtungia aerotolerans TaxID=2697043 RepID=A0A6P1MFI1_9BACT|nr:3'-5' exonuclease [Tichowtungia aerotolerans]QHI70768.1 3'-5' exonuclease [Tichowtungia aerotolerans]